MISENARFAVETLQKLGFQRIRVLKAFRDVVLMASPEQKKLRLKIHTSTTTSGRGGRHRFGINYRILPDVDYVVFFANWEPYILVVPSSRLEEIRNRDIDTSTINKSDQWVVNIYFNHEYWGQEFVPVNADRHYPMRKYVYVVPDPPPKPRESTGPAAATMHFSPAYGSPAWTAKSMIEAEERRRAKHSGKTTKRKKPPEKHNLRQSREQKDKMKKAAKIAGRSRQLAIAEHAKSEAMSAKQRAKVTQTVPPTKSQREAEKAWRTAEKAMKLRNHRLAKDQYLIAAECYEEMVRGRESSKATS